MIGYQQYTSTCFIIILEAKSSFLNAFVFKIFFIYLFLSYSQELFLLTYTYVVIAMNKLLNKALLVKDIEWGFLNQTCLACPLLDFCL